MRQVHSAKGLRNADVLTKSDAYVVCRMGPLGSMWEDKPSRSQKRSNTVSRPPLYSHGKAY